MKYYIWIVPPESLYSQLQEIIDGLSRKYKGPKFTPHMTLATIVEKDLSDIEKKLKDLVHNRESLRLSLGSVSFSTTFHQSVFVRVDSNAKLMQLNLDVKKLFGIENGVYMPHMSLLYGDHTMSVREEVVTKLLIPSTSFVVTELQVIQDGPTPKEWKSVAKIPFSTK